MSHISMITLCCLRVMFAFQGEVRALDESLVGTLIELPATEVVPASYAIDFGSDRAWRKGNFRIIPYGSLWGSALYGTERPFPGAYTLFIPSVDTEGEPAFTIDTRRTRLGINIVGPRIPPIGNAESSGKVEIDFHGAFIVENKPGVLLRHAYGEIKDDEFRLLAGQTWDVVSPLIPHILNYSVGWGGGNIGYRRSQVRYERYLTFSDTFLMTLQGSLNQNIVSDLTTVPGIGPEASSWPLIEARMATTYGPRGINGLPWTFGVSAHIGEQGFDFVVPETPKDDARVKTWSFNIDTHYPINDRFGVQGELFMGENLGTFLGGVIQGVSLFSRDGIRSRGGWFNFWHDLTDRFHVHYGAGIDDPIDVDIISGRRYNHFIFTNGVYDITKDMSVGVEVTSWKTLYRETRPGEPQLRPGESVLFEFTGKYNF